MKTLKNTLLLSIFIIAFTLNTNCQVSMLGTAGGVPTDYVGWDATTPFPLTVQHLGNQPIQINTDGINRIHINPNRISLINGYAGNVTNGFVGIGPNTVNGAYPNGIWDDVGPFSLLHLNGVIPNLFTNC